MNLPIVLPFYQGDAWLLDKNLMWYKELDGKLDYDCILAADDTVKMDGYVALAKTIFRSVRTIQFKRHKHSHWPWQQNNIFTNVAWEMSKQKEPWLWMETDAVPLKRGWIDTLRSEYEKGKKPFGGHWNSSAGVFNGVAIYPPNVATYSHKMMTAALIIGKDPQGRPYQPPWDAHGSKDVFPHLHVMNHVMQHVWDVNGVAPTFKDSDDVVKLVRPEVCVFHRCKDGTLIDRIRDPGRIGAKARCLVGLETVHLKSEEVKREITQPKKNPTASLFVVTYQGDFDWLPYLFKSIRKNCSGFIEIVAACPDKDDLQLKKIAGEGITAVGYDDRSFKSSFMGHLWAKMNADKFCKGDIIVHVDSDCIFTAPTTPQTYLTKDGRCINLCSSYASLGKSVPWQAWTEKALGRKVEFETMRRHGCCYPRGLYQRCREHFEKVNRRPLRELLEVLKGREEPFSEFCTMGAFGMYYMPEWMHFIDTANGDVPVNTIHQFSGAHYKPTKPEARAILAQHKLL